MDDRSSWDSLISQIIPLVRQLAQSDGQQRKLTVVAESFGGCLAFRLALAVPQLIANMVVVNSATCFNKSYSGIINLIAASNLLSLFPEQLYQVFSVACGMRHGRVKLGCRTPPPMHATHAGVFLPSNFDFTCLMLAGTLLHHIYVAYTLTDVGSKRQ